MNFCDKKVVVMGLGLFGGGVTVTRYLLSQGAQVLVTDLRSESQLTESLAVLANLPVKFRLGEHYPRDFTDADIVVVNPGVADSSSYLQLAQQRGVQLDTEINMFLRAVPCPVIGITGSNGKSTTTAMIAHILQAAGYVVWLGGNIGHSLLEELPQIKADHLVVMELSSFQLQRCAWLGKSPQTAVVTNLTVNHLDHHGTMDNYACAKQNILRFQQREDWCILNAKDPKVRTWSKYTCGQPIYFGENDSSYRHCVFNVQNTIYVKHDQNILPIMEIAMLRLPGTAYLQNAMAAIAVAVTRNIDPALICSALSSFSGLPHRLEFCGQFAGRNCYNDSDATTPESTIAAIEAIPAPIVLIAGGSAKGMDYDGLGKIIPTKVKALVLLGETGPQIAFAVTDANLPIVYAQNLAQAVQYSRELSQPGNTILLSPASASFGMFRNFAERGEKFKQLLPSILQ